jgi:CheY-like chemotaxis protein
VSRCAKIIWLEDEPETIVVIKQKMEKYCKDIKICQSFSSFSDDIEDFEDSEQNMIIIDIRMIFNREIAFSCFEKVITINNELDSGFEYFNHCLKNRFEKVKIVFFSSKPQKEARIDAKKHAIDTKTIVSKEYTLELITMIKDIK